MDNWITIAINTILASLLASWWYIEQQIIKKEYGQGKTNLFKENNKDLLGTIMANGITIAIITWIPILFQPLTSIPIMIVITSYLYNNYLTTITKYNYIEKIINNKAYINNNYNITKKEETK